MRSDLLTHISLLQAEGELISKFTYCSLRTESNLYCHVQLVPQFTYTVIVYNPLIDYFCCLRSTILPENVWSVNHMVHIPYSIWLDRNHVMIYGKFNTLDEGMDMVKLRLYLVEIKSTIISIILFCAGGTRGKAKTSKKYKSDSNVALFCIYGDFQVMLASCVLHIHQCGDCEYFVTPR